MLVSKKNSGVSPVIAIILMVAFCVALIALSSTIVFDLTESAVSESPDVSANIDTTSQNDKLKVSIVRNGNSDRVFIRGDGMGRKLSQIL